MRPESGWGGAAAGAFRPRAPGSRPQPLHERLGGAYVTKARWLRGLLGVLHRIRGRADFLTLAPGLLERRDLGSGGSTRRLHSGSEATPSRRVRGDAFTRGPRRRLHAGSEATPSRRVRGDAFYPGSEATRRAGVWGPHQRGGTGPRVSVSRRRLPPLLAQPARSLPLNASWIGRLAAPCTLWRRYAQNTFVPNRNA
jgi:hypothetical protein